MVRSRHDARKLTLTRRRFLGLLAAGAAGCGVFPFSRARVAPEGWTSFTPVRLPHPLPVYAARESFLASTNAADGSPASAILPPSGWPFVSASAK